MCVVGLVGSDGELEERECESEEKDEDGGVGESDSERDEAPAPPEPAHRTLCRPGWLLVLLELLKCSLLCSTIIG